MFVEQLVPKEITKGELCTKVAEPDGFVRHLIGHPKILFTIDWNFISPFVERGTLNIKKILKLVARYRKLRIKRFVHYKKHRAGQNPVVPQNATHMVFLKQWFETNIMQFNIWLDIWSYFKVYHQVSVSLTTITKVIFRIEGCT